MKIKREIKSENPNKVEGRTVNLAQKVKKKKAALSVLSITIFTSEYALILVV